MQTRYSLILVIAALLLAAGCEIEGFANSTRFKEDFHYSYALEPGGSLSVESFNGSINVYGWDKEEVEISGTRYAATMDLLDALKIDIVPSDEAVRIRTIRPSGRRGNMGASYTIYAPRRIKLERIDSSNGSVHIEDIEGTARLKTSNGKIRVVRLQGDIEAGTSNGGLELIETSGSAVLSTSNGGIKADAVRGHFEARTSNASIEARIIESGDSRPIRLHTSNGRVNLTLDEALTTDIRASSSNGSITVHAPSSLEAQLEANTSNGSITCDFDVLVRGGTTKKKTRLEGTIGGGGPLLDLDTSNGSIKILTL